MHNKITKAVTASLMAAAMLTTTVATVVPMSVSAGQLLGEQTFDYKGLPWHTCETNPAKQTFELTSDGTFQVTVKNPGGAAAGGESRWDLQFRHRNLTIKAGHTYKVHWEVKGSRAGIQVNSKIGNIKGDIELWNNNGTGPHSGGNWNPIITLQSADTWYKFDSTFTSTQDMEGAEWAFHYGGAGANQNTPCTQEGDVLSFDNMSLEDTTGSDGDWDTSNDLGVMRRDNSGLENNYISVNQVGYYTGLSKVATLGDNTGDKTHAASTIDIGTTALDFDLIDNATGESVYTGKTSPKGNDADSGDNVHLLDFTDFTTAGEYYLQCGDYVSFPFKIGDDIYSDSTAEHDMLTNAMNYYYQNRSGIDISSSYITSGDKSSLAHMGGHNPDTAYVQPEWVKSYLSKDDINKSYTITATGGWYDAGDHGKYVVNGGVSVWTLQNMYERAAAKGVDKFNDGSGVVVVPETGNSVPDVLDETKVELDFMLDMVVKSSDPMWGDKAGLVYHKLHDHKWTGLATKPWDYQSEWETERIVKPPTLAATLNFVACAAQAARLWKDYDSAYADKLLAAAKTSYEAYKKNVYDYTDAEKKNTKSLYAPMDQAIGGGAYGDTNVKDDAYWAACELFATTGESEYYTDLSDYSGAFEVVTTLDGGENSDSFGSFNWGNTASLGSLSLYLNNKNISASELGKIKDTLLSASDAYVAKENEQGYGIPYRETTFVDEVNIGPDAITGYEWGSNSFAINNAIVMAYAYDATKDITYLNGVSTAMDYILGRNPLSVSYVTGYGSYHISRPHHRYWSNELNSEFPVAPDGVMSGGPGSGMQDPYIQSLGFKRGSLASQRCYVDSIEAWSVNEVTINWNAPFAWVVSFMQDEANVEGQLVVTPSSVELAVDETETLKPTVNGEAVNATFESSDPSVATVDATGKVTGVADGTATITVTFGDKTVKVEVTVDGEPTTDTTTDTTEDPSTTGVTIPSYTGTADLLYGDTNLSNSVTSADVVTLNKYLVNKKAYALKTDEGGKAYEQADCKYDKVLTQEDSVAIINFCLEKIAQTDLGPKK